MNYSNEDIKSLIKDIERQAIPNDLKLEIIDCITSLVAYASENYSNYIHYRTRAYKAECILDEI